MLFHTDATHTFTRLPIDLSGGGVAAATAWASAPPPDARPDLVTVSGHTIHGPRGIGALYVRKKTPHRKWMDGGFQEFDLRAGVEDIPGAIGFAAAVDLVTPEENAQPAGACATACSTAP